jgi:hypothetical protein
MKAPIRNEAWIRAAAAEFLGATWRNASEERKASFVAAITNAMDDAGLADDAGRDLRYGFIPYGPCRLNGWHCLGKHLTYSRFPRAKAVSK